MIRTIPYASNVDNSKENAHRILTSIGAGKEAVNGVKLSVLQQLVKTALLEGVLMQKEGSLYLQTKEGVSVPVTVQGETVMGKLLPFFASEVVDGKVVLVPVEGANDSLVDKTLKTLQLPDTSQMKACVEQFIEKQLPLDKTTLLQGYYLHKQAKLPLEALTTMFQKSGAVTAEEVAALTYLKKEGITGILDKINQLLQQVQTPVEKETLLKSYMAHMEPQEVADALGEVLREAKEIKLLPETSRVEVAETLANIEKQVVLGQSQKSEVTAQLEKLLFETLKLNEADKAPLYQGLLSKLVKKYVAPENQVETSSKVGEASIRSTEETILQVQSRLTKILRGIAGTSISEEGNQLLKEMIQPLQVLGKINVEAQYFLLPMWSQGELKEGEIYFFEPKKEKKDGKKDLYVVISLDLVALEHIEIHLRKQDKELFLSVQVKEEAIRKVLEGNMSSLQEAIAALGYQLVQCNYAVMGEVPSFFEERVLPATSKTKQLDVKV